MGPAYATALRAPERLAEAGMGSFKISVVITHANVNQLDEFEALADRIGAQLRLTRAAPVRPRRRRLGGAASDAVPAPSGL